MMEIEGFISIIREYNYLISKSINYEKISCDFNDVFTMDQIFMLHDNGLTLISKLEENIKKDRFDALSIVDQFIEDFYLQLIETEKLCNRYHIPNPDFETPEYMHAVQEIFCQLLIVLKKHYPPIAYRKKFLYQIYLPVEYKSIVSMPHFYLDNFIANELYRRQKAIISKKAYDITQNEGKEDAVAAKIAVKEALGFSYKKFTEVIRKEIERKHKFSGVNQIKKK